MAWYWGCGLGFAILFMSGIDLLHRNVGGWNSQRIPRVSTQLPLEISIADLSGPVWTCGPVGLRACGPGPPSSVDGW